MSHYAVAVFCNTPIAAEFDKLMEPFSEQDEKYFIFEPVTDEYLAERWEEFHAMNPSWEYERWLNDMFHLRNGQYGHWYNPNAKYDYYSLDGKSYLYDPTAEALRAHDNEYPSFWKKSELDWFALDEDHKGPAFWRKHWRDYSENGDGVLYSGSYYEKRFGSEEQFVKEMMRPTVPYAFVTPDGVWHAPGNIGWFACSDETAETMDAYWEEWCDFIKNAPDCYVSLLDCHI